jgi:hypothetical protein
MSHGDAPDDFVFPPFIPPAITRPQAATPPPLPDPVPAGRPVMPWDAETPIIGAPAESPDEPAGTPEAEVPAEANAEEELPWLELPEPRATPGTSEEPAPVQDASGALPDWMTWDARDAADAAAGIMDVPLLDGMEPFVPEEAMAVGDDTDVFPYGDPGIDDDEALELDAAEGPSMEPVHGDRFPAEYGDPGFDGDDDLFQPLPVEADYEPAPPTVGDAEFGVPTLEGGAHSGSAPAADERFAGIADRLEAIARDLRERPDELFGGRTGDDLGRMIAAYALGFTHGRGG